MSASDKQHNRGSNRPPSDDSSDSANANEEVRMVISGGQAADWSRPTTTATTAAARKIGKHGKCNTIVHK